MDMFIYIVYYLIIYLKSLNFKNITSFSIFQHPLLYVRYQNNATTVFYIWASWNIKHINLVLQDSRHKNRVGFSTDMFKLHRKFYFKNFPWKINLCDQRPLLVYFSYDQKGLWKNQTFLIIVYLAPKKKCIDTKESLR